MTTEAGAEAAAAAAAAASQLELLDASLSQLYGWHVWVCSLLTWWQWLVLIGTVFYFMHRAIVAIIRQHQESVYWLWDNGGDDVTVPREVINTDVEALSFPQDFLFGVATSAHQIEGGDGGLNQWSTWESSKSPAGVSRIKDGSRVSSGGQHWLRVDEDIKLLKELGVNAYRFSVEWSKVQPGGPDEWNASVIAHYSDEIDQLLSAGITPMLTLQHFTIPLWFEELGGFESEANIPHFVAYAERLFRAFRNRVSLWITINEPFFYSFNGYMSGVFPPGKTDPALCGLVLRNLLEAHVAAYQRLRAVMDEQPLRSDASIRIGLVHCIYHFDCWNPLNGFDWFISRHLNQLFNESVLHFFATGIFHWKPVGHRHTFYSSPSAPRCLDFMGLNYHSHSFVRYRFKSFFTHNPIEIMLPHTSLALMSDATNACIYPEGLYRSLMQLKQVLPGTDIFVTENGIADRHDDRRHLYLRRHMFALSKAIKDGANVKGYFFWTLFDCFEWHEGHTLKFGLFSLDKRSQKRTLRDGSKYYRDVCQRFARKSATATTLPATAGRLSQSSSSGLTMASGAVGSSGGHFHSSSVGASPVPFLSSRPGSASLTPSSSGEFTGDGGHVSASGAHNQPPRDSISSMSGAQLAFR